MVINRRGSSVHVKTTVLPSNNKENEMQLTPAQQEVWKVVQTFNQAYASGNTEGYLEHVHPSYVNWGLRRLVPRDRAALRRELDRYFMSGNKTLAVDELVVSIVVEGDTAIVLYFSHEAYRDVDGKEGTSSERWMEVLIRERGRWLLLGDHGGGIKVGA
jgi:ketosteroid isomerase-like protein